MPRVVTTGANETKTFASQQRLESLGDSLRRVYPRKVSQSLQLVPPGEGKRAVSVSQLAAKHAASASKPSVNMRP